MLVYIQIYPLRKKASNSARVGAAAEAPFFVVDRAPQAAAKCTAPARDIPSSRATARAPLKLSPAATVSIASTLNGATKPSPEGPQKATPLAPSFTTAAS